MRRLLASRIYLQTPPREHRGGSAWLTANGKVEMVTWNARALFIPVAGKRRLRLNLLRSLLRHATTLCVQETHGAQPSIDAFAADIDK